MCTRALSYRRAVRYVPAWVPQKAAHRLTTALTAQDFTSQALPSVGSVGFQHDKCLPADNSRTTSATTPACGNAHRLWPFDYPCCWKRGKWLDMAEVGRCVDVFSGGLYDATPDPPNVGDPLMTEFWVRPKLDFESGR